MINEVIRAEIEIASNEYLKYKSSKISDDRAFCYMLLSVFFGVNDFNDKFDCVTDGSHDGGIDFIYFDEEDSKLFICQAKYTDNLTPSCIRNEFDKICDTVNNFRKSNTGSYNETLKRILQNALDRLPDDDQDNIEIILFTAARFYSLLLGLKTLKRLSRRPVIIFLIWIGSRHLYALKMI